MQGFSLCLSQGLVIDVSRSVRKNTISWQPKFRYNNCESNYRKLKESFQDISKRKETVVQMEAGNIPK